MTERHNTKSRIAELSAHTGVPEDFELVYRAQVFDAYIVEQKAHTLLAKSCVKKKEFFQCDVLQAVAAIHISADSDLIDEESHIAQPIDGMDEQLKSEAIRLSIRKPRGRSITGVTLVPIENQPKDIRRQIAWSLHSRTYGYLFYGSSISNTEKLIKEATKDFPEVSDFCDAVLLETPAGQRVRDRQLIQAECDRENAAILRQNSFVPISDIPVGSSFLRMGDNRIYTKKSADFFFDGTYCHPIDQGELVTESPSDFYLSATSRPEQSKPSQETQSNKMGMVIAEKIDSRLETFIQTSRKAPEPEDSVSNTERQTNLQANKEWVYSKQRRELFNRFTKEKYTDNDIFWVEGSAPGFEIYNGRTVWVGVYNISFEN